MCEYYDVWSHVDCYHPLDLTVIDSLGYEDMTCEHAAYNTRRGKPAHHKRQPARRTDYLERGVNLFQSSQKSASEDANKRDGIYG